MLWRRNRWLLLGAAALVGLHAGVYRGEGDFIVFHTAALRVFEGAPLYHPEESLPFKYSPQAALLLAPLALLPFAAARAVWAALTVLAVARFMRWCRAHAGASHPASHPFALLLAFPYLLHLVSLGQCDGLLVWLMAESEERAESRPWLSGAAWAVACLFKPHFAVFALVALGFRQWRRLAGLALTLAASSLVAIAWRGIEPFRQGLSLLGSTTVPMLCSHENQSVFGLACAHLIRPEEGTRYLLVAGTAGGLVVLGLAAVTIRAWRDPPRARFFAAASAFFLTCFLAPLGWWNYLIGLLPFFYLLFAEADSESGRARIARVALLVAGVVSFLNHDFISREGMEPLLRAHHYGLSALLTAIAAALCTYLRPPQERAAKAETRRGGWANGLR
ncbi:MAG: DUF2029 domain-containing protein [Myxococcales bacterium]|nr:DUF2029 domain-containing protein [Myxococcales bacterium]